MSVTKSKRFVAELDRTIVVMNNIPTAMFRYSFHFYDIFSRFPNV